MIRSKTIQRTPVAVLAAAALFAALFAFVPPAHALKIATWNVVNYQNPEVVYRFPAMRTVMAAMDPDVIILQELNTQEARDSFLVEVLNYVEPGQWAAGNYITTAQSCAFYKTAKINLTFAGGGVVTSGPRAVLAVRLKFPGYVSREAEFRLYSMHLKAGTPDPGTTDSTTRRLECGDLRTTLNNVNLAVNSRHFLVGGDTNFYGDWEGGYQRLTESQADNDGQGIDFLNMPGTWNNGAYAPNHTQSPCGGGCPAAYFSGGGLDDRFDLFLSSSTMRDGEGLDFVPGSYLSYGNDGQHFNQSVNGGGFNGAVGLPVANALFGSSDHLPVMMTIQAPAKIAATSQLDFGRVIVGAAAARNLSVSNPAVVPADELTYTLAAPAGFSAPGGTLQELAGAAPNLHAISMNTSSPATLSGALVVACDDPDSSAKNVLLSGTVIAHAAPSLDSLAIARADTVDFGAHLAGQFVDVTRCVHNVGWSTLQSKLELTNGVISGGAGRFSIVGGFSPSEIAGTSRCFGIHFSDSGATLDSTYQATLTFSSVDEPLPGGTALPPITIVLRASAMSSAGAAGVPDVARGRVAFFPPTPNPFRGGVDLSFDLPRDGRVSLVAFDLSGRRVSGILDGFQAVGRHTVRWRAIDDSGAPLSAGVYLVQLKAGGFTATRRVAYLP